MKRDMHSRLAELRRTGEVQTGRQLSEKLLNNSGFDLFPGEGREEETAFGKCYLRELKFPLHYRHGKSELGGILSCRGEEIALPARDESLLDLDPRRSLFLDIETTGLAGGTGTWAFLIGLGWLQDNHFLLRQYFLRRPAEERSILDHFAATANNFPAMISFNGKMFDLPLIQTRQLLAGFRQTVPELHLDLLHCARTLWKKRLPSRSLRSLEENLLGLNRYNDIPGAEIPAVYFDYLRRGRTTRLKQVFHHNTLDILSMVILLERISSLLSGRCLEHPAEALALGLLCLEKGRPVEGAGFLRQAAECRDEELAVEASLALALFHKRRAEWPEAEKIWLSIDKTEMASSTASVELAKYYEHRCRDYATALDYTEKAIAVTSDHHAKSAKGELSPTALNHRRRRLIRRMKVSSLPPNE